VIVTGGSSVVVSSTAANTATAGTGTALTLGAVNVTGTSATRSVSVTESAPVTAANATGASDNANNATTATRGIINGTVTINDANQGSSSAANTITSVSINNAGATTISSTALNTLSLAGTLVGAASAAAVATTEGGSASTVAGNRTLTLNTGTGFAFTTGSNTVGAYSDASNQFSTINAVTSGNFYFVNANSAANTTVTIQDTALRTLNISGTGLLGFTNAAPTSANAATPSYVPSLANANGINTAITAINLSGGSSLLADLSGMPGLATLSSANTTGNVNVVLNGTVTSFTGGAGRSVIELTANDVNKVINLGGLPPEK
jgi:S-layer protein